ncbi:MAG: GIY-YIG nuclease family protein [Bacteroidales bacterium]|nr:GIY-YIG nuclease family protein [Bacteroidales bacterium]
MNNLDNIISSVKEISIKHNIEMSVNVFQCIDLISETKDVSINWKKFEKYSGVYCFIKANKKKIIYIGESSKGLGFRLNTWLREPKNAKEIKISEEIQYEDFIVIFAIEENYLARAVEKFLLDKYETMFNNRDNKNQPLFK